MPFCPKCGYEYRPEIETCPECGRSLNRIVIDVRRDRGRTRRYGWAVPVDDADAGYSKPISGGAVLELALVATAAPWVWYLLPALISRFATALGFVLLWIVPACLLAGALGYGYRRNIDTRARTMAVACAASWAMQVGIGLALSGTVPEPWKLVLVVPYAAILSLVALILVWVGATARRLRRIDYRVIESFRTPPEESGD